MVIPKIIHRVWLGPPMPSHLARYGETWVEHHPDWQFRLWTEADLDWLTNQRLFDEAEQHTGSVGLFDPRYFLYYEEVDLCRAAKAGGWKVMYCPVTNVIHVGGESAKSVGALTSSGRQLSALQMESELLYFRKHYGIGGPLANLALGLAGDTYLAVKRIFGRGRGSGNPFATTLLGTRLFLRTRCATRPTR